MRSFIYYFEWLIQNEFFTHEELELVTNINGNTIQTLEDCIWSRYGYTDIEDFINDYKWQ